MEEDKFLKQITDQAVSAAEINEAAKIMGSDDRITQEQFAGRVKKIKKVAEFRKSGKFRILSVDTDDYASGELIYDFDREEDALMCVLLDRKENQALQNKDVKSMKEASKIKEGLISGKTSAQVLEPGLTTQKLRERLSGWANITSEVAFLYNPKGDLIGEFPI